MIKICAWCKKEFEAKNEKRVCCCASCSEEYRKERAKRYQIEHKDRYQAKKPKRYCEKCGKEITGNRKKFCSDACYVAHVKKTGMPVICPQCGKEFIKKHTEVYCSLECRKAVKRERNRSPKLEIVKAPPRKQTKKNALVTAEKRARELGLSYGEYQVHMYAGDLDEYVKRKQRERSTADNVYTSAIGAGKARLKRKAWNCSDE